MQDYYNNEELYHHGVKGMKWGQHIFGKEPSGTSKRKKISRRNDPNSIIGAVQRRITSVKNNVRNSIISKIENKPKEVKKEEVKTNTSKSVKKMSDAELTNAINRKRMEQAYRDLDRDGDAGKKFANKFFNDAIIPGVTAAGKTLIGDKLTELGKKYLGLDKADDGDYQKKWEQELYKRKLENEDFTPKHQGVVYKNNEAEQSKADKKARKEQEKAEKKAREEQEKAERKAREEQEKGYAEYQAQQQRYKDASKRSDARYDIKEEARNSYTKKEYHDGFKGDLLDSGKSYVNNILSLPSPSNVIATTTAESEGRSFVVEILDRLN